MELTSPEDAAQPVHTLTEQLLSLLGLSVTVEPPSEILDPHQRDVVIGSPQLPGGGDRPSEQRLGFAPFAEPVEGESKRARRLERNPVLFSQGATGGFIDLSGLCLRFTVLAVEG